MTGSVSLSDLLERVRTRLRQKGGNVNEVFLKYDSNKSSTLDKYPELLNALNELIYEFSAALNDLGIPVNKTEFSQLMNYFDKNGDGNLDIDEFLLAVSTPLPASRASIVLRAFRSLDSHGDGQITIEGLLARFNGSRHPLVLRGRKTAQQAAQDMANAFLAMGDGIVTLDEFQQYYANISPNFDTDAKFESLMQSLWGPY